MNKILFRNQVVNQLIKYGIVGGVAFIVDYGLLLLLTIIFEIHYLVSAAISFVAGLVVNYILSRRFVFTDNRLSNRQMEFLIFSIIGVFGVGINEIIIYYLTDVLGIHYMISKIVSTLVVFFWNFFARKYFLFIK